VTALTPNYSARQLRMELLLLLRDLLGVYKLPDGSTTPAIFVVGRQRLPRDWAVSGVEVTIQEAPSRRAIEMVGDSMQVKSWPVRIINYDHTDTLDIVHDRLLRTWPDCAPVYIPATDETYDQITVQIRDFYLSTLIRRYPDG
jgi:hypothetical protein